MLKELSSTSDKHYQDTSCIFTKVIGQIIESTKFVNPDLVAKRIPINLKGLQRVTNYLKLILYLT